MPATKNAMTRYMILDELLSNRYHNYSLDDLTREVSNRLAEIYPGDGVVRRTIEKDIRYLEFEGPFLVEIERYSASSYNEERQEAYTKRCLRYADPSFSIFKKELTSDEEYLLREALSILGQFEGLPNLEGLEKLRLGLRVAKDDRQIISFTKNPLENSNLLGELFTSISQRQVIELYYHTFQKPEDKRCIILNPYLIKEYNRRWYLIAASRNDGKLLNFSLDRIDKCTPLPALEYKPFSGNINEQFEDIIGVTLFDDSPLLKIVFWVSDKSKDYVATKPIHESQRKLSNKDTLALREKYQILDGGMFFRIDCKENYELIRELSSFGDNLIVVDPSIIQEKIVDRIDAMSKKYHLLRT